MANVHPLIDDIRRNDRMTDDDLLKIRRAFGRDLEFDAAEADTLFILNDLTEKPDGWTPYFTSVLAAYVDDREAPHDYVSDDSAAWLIDKISEDGVVETETELKLLLTVLKTAHHVPERLQKFALDQVCLAVTSGKGVVYSKMLTPNVIGEAEVDLLRRVLYATSGKGGIGITKTEAETLFALNDATSGRANHDSWQALFVHALANHLMMVAAPVMPTPEEALSRQIWLLEPTPKGRHTLFSSFRALFAQRADAKASDGSGGYANLNTANVARAEKIDLSEANWLVERLTADGQQDDNETALLQFIKDECPDIDAALQAYVHAV